MKKFIVFDFDGTLVDSKALAVEIFNQIAVKHNMPQVGPHNVDKLKHLSMYARLKELEVPFYKIPSLAAAFLKIYRASIERLHLFNGIKETLLQLKEEGYTIAIISSNSEAAIKAFLQNNGLDFIGLVYASSNIFGKEKVIKNFLEKYSPANGNMLYIGDELRDIVACKKNGVKIIWVSWGFDNEMAVEGSNPDFGAAKPAEIVGIVNNYFAQLSS